VLAGRAKLPPLSEQQSWEQERITERGDGVPFTLIYPDFEEYFETVRKLAGEPTDGVGRRLPPFDQAWLSDFMNGHEIRKRWWREQNEKARQALPQMRANL
jgi:hypothetical protein